MLLLQSPSLFKQAVYYTNLCEYKLLTYQQFQTLTGPVAPSLFCPDEINGVLSVGSSLSSFSGWDWVSSTVELTSGVDWVRRLFLDFFATETGRLQTGHDFLPPVNQGSTHLQ